MKVTNTGIKNGIIDKIMENESQTATDFIQGVNSWISMQGGEQSK